MVDYADDCEPTITRTDAIRKARKEHRCNECHRVIEKGEPYRYMTYVEIRYKYGKHLICQHCQIVCQWLSAECGGYLYETVYEDVREHVTEGYGMGVARLAAGMNMRWRHHGKLMRLPKLPATTHQRMS